MLGNVKNIQRLKTLNLNRKVEKLIKIDDNFRLEDIMKSLSKDPLIEYNFKSGKAIQNNGKFEGTVKNCVFHEKINDKINVLEFNKTGSYITIPSEEIFSSITTITVSLEIKFEDSDEDRINLFENSSARLAFTLRKKNGMYYPRVSVNLANGWHGITADHSINPNKWYNLSAVFTGEEIFIFEDNKCIARRVFEDAELEPVKAQDSFIGTWVNGRRNQFKGMLASFKLWDDIPRHLDKEIERAVEMGIGAIESKYIDLGEENSFLGKMVRPEIEITKKIDGKDQIVGRRRDFDKGTIFWSSATGAKEVHGHILAWYNKLGGPSGKLGFPRTDESPGNIKSSRISRFENGAMYWSNSTGAHEITNHLYAKYVTLGEEAGYHGLPTSGEESFGDGHCVTFQKGRIFYSEESGAHEVHGSILSKYLSLNPNMAGADEKISLGLPTSDELDILDKNGSPTGKKLSNFQNGAIYWSGSTGAHEVSGSLYKKYIELGGPSGALGLPIYYDGYFLNEKLFLFNDFEKGIIVYKGKSGDKLFENEEDTKVFTDLELYLGEVTTGKITDDDTGGWDKSAEIYTQSWVRINDKYLDRGKRRPSGHAGTSYNINKTYSIPNIKHDTKIWLKIKVWDWDRIGANDFLGHVEKSFGIEELWGMDNGFGGIYNKENLTSKGGDAPNKSSVQTTFAIRRPSKIDPGKSFREQFWWEFRNINGPAPLSEEFYANTFKDVNLIGDSWWEIALNPMDSAIYEAYKNLSEKGNCFGMSLEALYAIKNNSLFTIPLSKYEVDNPDGGKLYHTSVPASICTPINRKHGYQLGSSAVSWIAKKVVSSDATSPKATFNSVRKLIDKGDNAVISMFSISKGSGHAVLAYDYTNDGDLKKIFVADPNHPYSGSDAKANLGYIQINTRTDTFKFYTGTENRDGSPKIMYQTGSTHVGLVPADDTYMIHFPYHVLSSQPVTPYLEILLGLTAIFGGLFLVFGDAETEQISSGNNDFYEYSRGEKGIKKNGIKGLVRVPIVDGPKKPFELYAMDGAPPESIEFTLKGLKDGAYTQHVGTFNNTIKVEAPTKRDEKDSIYIEGTNTSRPNISIKTTAVAKNFKLSYGTLKDIKKKDNILYEINFEATKDESIMGIDPLEGSLTISQGGSLKEILIDKHFIKDNVKIKHSLKLNPSIENEVIKIRDLQIDNVKNEVLIEKINPETGKILNRVKDRFR